MNWQEVCEDPSLQNLPYKIELDQWGRIIMSPRNIRNGIYQFEVGALLKIKLAEFGGNVITECAIQTRLGVRVADVAWASASFIEKHEGESSFSSAPEICIEVQSPGNSEQELEEKKNSTLNKVLSNIGFVLSKEKLSFLILKGQFRILRLFLVFQKM